MVPKKRAQLIYSILDTVYGELKPRLQFADCFQLVIAVILSAQCTDEQVNKVTAELFIRFPEPGDLAEADISSIEKIVHSTGFFREKAKYCKNTARKITRDFGGKVPSSMKELLTLPGVGRKSANVILGFCFGKPAVIADTHFIRTARRTGISDGENPEFLEKKVREMVPEENLTRLSMLMNVHGRTVCRAKKPDCPNCRIKEYCEAYPEITGLLR